MRLLILALLLSVAVHLTAGLVVVFLPRVLPQEASPQQEAAVELLMVEKKGAEPSEAGQSTEENPAPAPAEKTTETPKQEAQKSEPDAPASKPTPAPPVAANADEPPPPPEHAPAKPEAAEKPAHPDAAEARQEPPHPRQAPVFNLEGTDSDSNAIALGPRILPAMPDNRFRNRPPVYPTEAEMLGQHGSVVVLIHVSETGAAIGVDVTESSGVNVLDQAAVAAVRKWHFHPAMKEGRAVPSEMPLRFIFEAN